MTKKSQHDNASTCIAQAYVDTVLKNYLTLPDLFNANAEIVHDMHLESAILNVQEM